MESKEHTYIGIDPAFRSSGIGFAIIYPDRNAQTMNFKCFPDWYRWATEEDQNINCRFIVENSNEQNTSFNMKHSKAAVAKISRNVGMNQAVSQIMVDILTEVHGAANVWSISPKRKGAKIKSNSLITGFASAAKVLLLNQPKNQDQRDALKCALIGLTSWKK